MSILTETLGDILDNYADVIEGGNGHRGSGTAYKGIPGTRSWHELADTTFTSTGGTTTTVVDTAVTISVSDAARLVRTDGPSFYLLCTAQASNTQNTGAARIISSHDGTNTFTVETAYPEAPANGDTFKVVEGFARSPDGVDLDDDVKGYEGGWDRYFTLSALPGVRLNYNGSNTETWQTTMNIKLRLVKKARQHELAASALENVSRIRSIITRGTFRASGAQALIATDDPPEVIIDDKNKVVVSADVTLIYRFESNFI